jgi:hypothetical protein
LRTIARATAASARGQDDHEDREHLAVEAPAVVPREGDEVDVRRVQDHLDAHEHVEHVPPHDDRDDAEREERRGDGQVGSDAHHAPPSLGTESSRFASGTKSDPFRRAM